MLHFGLSFLKITTTPHRPGRRNVWITPLQGHLGHPAAAALTLHLAPSAFSFPHPQSRSLAGCWIVPAESAPWRKQQRDHGVAQALTERAEELAVLYIVASVQAQSLLPPLLLSLNGIKIPSQPEDRGVKIRGEALTPAVKLNVLRHFSHNNKKHELLN